MLSQTIILFANSKYLGTFNIIQTISDFLLSYSVNSGYSEEELSVYLIPAGNLFKCDLTDEEIEEGCSMVYEKGSIKVLKSDNTIKRQVTLEEV